MTTSMAGRVSRTCWHLLNSSTSNLCLKANHGIVSTQNSLRRQSTVTRMLDDGVPEAVSSSTRSLKNILPSDQQPFSSLEGLISHNTLKAITVNPYRYTHMTPVQAAVFEQFPHLSNPYNPALSVDGTRAPRDLLVKARTGTGKTAAFVIPAIEQRLKALEAHGRQVTKDAGLRTDKHLADRARRVFAREHAGSLIISPTRELAMQIALEAQNLSYHHKEIEVRLFVGGSSRGLQMRDWMRGRRDIVVGTPGRLRDVLSSEPEVAKGLSKTPLVILDEADTLLDLGFRDDIEAIMEYLPRTPERQTFMFSATVSRNIQQIARKVLDKNHAFINCVTEDSPVHAHVAQYHTVLPEASAQIPHILRLLAHDQLTNPGVSKTVVFLPTTKQTQLFATLLREIGRNTLPAGRATRIYEMHSKRPQGARTSTSDAFRHDKSGASILITSDVSARGVDYPGVTRVIQVGIPPGAEAYVHRVGRTGRAGTMGRGDLVLLPWEVGFVTWQMNAIPLKSVTVNETKSQLEALASRFDADPKAFFDGVQTSEGGRDSRGRPSGAMPPAAFPSPYTPVLAQLESEVRGLLDQVDQDAVRETVTSVLGYYLGRAHELRLEKNVILEGCKTWSVEALGLPTPPYISEAFLKKLGVSGGRSKSTWGAPSDERGKFNRGQQNFGSRGRGRDNYSEGPRKRGWDTDYRTRPEGFGRRESNSGRMH